MKTMTFLFIVLLSFVSFGQTENEGDVSINETLEDDAYRAGGTIRVNAVVQGDLVIAGGSLFVNDSINGDLTAAGGELYLHGYIADDVRIAVGRVTIDSEIGDDLVVFGGEVILTDSAKINGNLICYAGNIEINGEILGKLEVKGSDVFLNGSVNGNSKIVGEDINLGANSKFYKEVEYYNSDGEIDFTNSLVNTQARFNENLSGEKTDLSLTTFGTSSLMLWVFYICSAFLVILVFHALFKTTFSHAAEDVENNWLKSLGFGLIYLIGIPVLIIIAFLLIIGIPLGLFATAIFIFSLLFGHLIAALLLVYYFKHKKEMNWGFWSVTFLALSVAIILRLLTMIPYAGILISVVILSITYGALTLMVIHSKKPPIKNQALE